MHLVLDRAHWTELSLARPSHGRNPILYPLETAGLPLTAHGCADVGFDATAIHLGVPLGYRPDHGVPESPIAVMRMLASVRERQPLEDEWPVDPPLSNR